MEDASNSETIIQDGQKGEMDIHGSTLDNCYEPPFSFHSTQYNENPLKDLQLSRLVDSVNVSASNNRFNKNHGA